MGSTVFYPLVDSHLGAHCFITFRSKTRSLVILLLFIQHRYIVNKRNRKHQQHCCHFQVSPLMASEKRFLESLFDFG